ncbi:MAG: hypothetical protein KME16_08405 [Scytolyngbya sp. HA4215-MV1]|jgi:hypothetical protein|nr:hypothetical protein [Scytolyngbya sp. HA4215-MV1]
MHPHPQPFSSQAFFRQIADRPFTAWSTLALLGLIVVLSDARPVSSQQTVNDRALPWQKLAQLAQNSATPLPPGSSPAIEEPVPPIFPANATPFRVQPVEGKVKIKVVNTASVEVQYGVLGESQSQGLLPKATVNLEVSSLPTTLTFYPKEKRFIRIYSQTSAESNVLEVRLIETQDMNANRHALVIHKTGLFFTE